MICSSNYLFVVISFPNSATTHKSHVCRLEAFGLGIRDLCTFKEQILFSQRVKFCRWCPTSRIVPWKDKVFLVSSIIRLHCISQPPEVSGLS
jgi:hypothetical protein